MGSTKTKFKPASQRKKKQKFQRQNDKLVEENGMTMVQRSGQSRYDDILNREDVAAASRSRDKAVKAVSGARESKNKAMAAKRRAEKAAETAQEQAEEERKLRQTATFAMNAEHASRMRAEEDARAARKEAEEERGRIQLLMQKIARLGEEKKVQEKKFDEMARKLGLAERGQTTAPTPAVANPNVRLRHVAITEARRAAQRERELETMRKLVSTNATLRRQVCR